MTAAYLAPSFTVGQQFFTNQGVILSGGLIYTYQAGTTTPQNTYTDSTATVANANPIVLDSAGRLTSNVWLATGVPTKFVLATSAGTTEGVAQDYVTGVNDPLAGGASSEWASYAVAPTYVNTTSFSLVGDQTSLFTVGRRVKARCTSGLVYGTVTASVYTSLTTITLALDSTLLDSGLSAVSYGLLSDLSTPTPGSISALATGSVLAGAGSGPIVAATAAQIVTAIGTTPVTNATNLAGGAAGEVPYQSGAGASAFTAAGTTGQVLVSGGTGSPTWTSSPSVGLGKVGQVWSANLSGSRSMSTTYTNSTANPMYVNATISVATSPSNTVNVTVNGVTVSMSSSGSSGDCSVFFIVPPGQTYSISNTQSVTGYTWYEFS